MTETRGNALIEGAEVTSNSRHLLVSNTAGDLAVSASFLYIVYIIFRRCVSPIFIPSCLSVSDTKVIADDIAENAWICVVTSKDQLLLNHAPQVYTLIHSDLTLTCFDFEL